MKGLDLLKMTKALLKESMTQISCKSKNYEIIVSHELSTGSDTFAHVQSSNEGIYSRKALEENHPHLGITGELTL